MRTCYPGQRSLTREWDKWDQHMGYSSHVCLPFEPHPLLFHHLIRSLITNLPPFTLPTFPVVCPAPLPFLPSSPPPLLHPPPPSQPVRHPPRVRPLCLHGQVKGQGRALRRPLRPSAAGRPAGCPGRNATRGDASKRAAGSDGAAHSAWGALCCVSVTVSAIVSIRGWRCTCECTWQWLCSGWQWR